MHTETSAIEYRDTNMALLFVLGMLLVCIDLINVDLGGFKLKVAYVAFVAYVVIFAYGFGFNVEKRNLSIALILLASFTPSLLLTTNPKTSAAFYAGSAMCLAIMMCFARMTSLLGTRAIPLLCGFYRLSVVISVLFVAVGFQKRGSFLFYEASYYAIALIPYLCITFGRMFEQGLRKVLLDLGCIIVAIVVSASVSLVLWAGLAFVAIYLFSGKAKLVHIAVMAAAVAVFLYCAYIFHTRTQLIFDKIGAVYEDPSLYLDLLLFVAGNRIQRVLVAYETFVAHPWVGVGLGALRSYASANYTNASFTLDGASAADFETTLNATNIYLELAAEAGILGLAGFAIVIAYVAKAKGAGRELQWLKAALLVTMLSLLIESSYLRTYVWALYGIVIGLARATNVETAQTLSSADRRGDSNVDVVVPSVS